MRRLILRQLCFRPPFASRLHHSLSPRIRSSPIGYVTNFFSQAFHRTHFRPSLTLLHSLFFSTFKPCSVHSLYNPINFNDFVSVNHQNDDLGVSELVELVQRTKNCTSRKEAIDFLASSGISPDATQVYLAIWKLQDDWKLVLLIFELTQKWGCISDKLLGLIVWVLGTHHKFDTAWSLIRDCYRLVDTRQAMFAIIDRYAAANNHEKAIRTFDFMEKLTACPDQNAFYNVINSLCNYGNIEEAEEFMLNNKKLYPLETDGFNIILHGWCDISVDVIEAKRIWREMARYCVMPNAMSYTHMISCFSRVGNLFDSLRLYDDMNKRGLTPGLDVYNSLMYVMVLENCSSEALKILRKTKEMGLQPDSQSYNCLICPLCEAGKFEEARNLLSAMTQEGVRPTRETYQAFLKGANLQHTFEILSLMRNSKVGPDNNTFLLVFDRFFKLREPENVLKVWVEMRQFGVHPESEHYQSVIHGLANCGCSLKAKELHTEMLSNGFVDDPKLKNLLQGPEQGSVHGRVGSKNFVRHPRDTKALRTSRIRPHNGSKKRGGISSRKNQKLE
ncbi:pentatricopeptide repeat-containing protein At1g80880, mitochondrial [Amaranthus tricolor]|uniref:pentatricopeptide repeat-containing protein At1g80880, mitochondrial n=1 Tax=Amaranthus tricolor TaxID=29722 RepID=UPI002589FB27|nr:pentatricopeptide repeat-containing protein At1g80880, mitochondrial [Amaranthus tricolor]